jgi:hypothetical protein
MENSCQVQCTIRINVPKVIPKLHEDGLTKAPDCGD